MPTLSDFPEDVQYIPMSFEEYLALPDKPKAEYVDGVAVVSPFARRDHNRAALRLAVRLQDALPGTDVVPDCGVRLPQRQRYRVPDVSVFPVIENVLFSETMPVLVVEVLSPSTRAEDTVRKSVEYAKAGIGQYWVVDLEAKTLTVMRNVDGFWECLVELTDQAPTGVVEVEGHGSVDLDLSALLDQPA